MPFSVRDVPKYNKGLTRSQKRKWVSIANNTRKACLSDGGDASECDIKAIKIANGVLAKEAKKEQAMAKIANVNTIPDPVAVEIQDKPAEEAEPVSEYHEEELVGHYIGPAVFSFTALEAEEQAAEISEELRELVDDYTQLLRNVVYWFDGDKVAQVNALTGEFVQRLQDVLQAPPELPGESDKPAPVSVPVVKIGESMGGVSIESIAEGEGGNSLLKIKAVIINPGWGNKVDNNFYPAEVLAGNKDRFVGAKMYETDHRDEEKSTRTWVSTITDVMGFTDDGAPIASVAVHDPDFAERVKNLNAAGLLEKMECSIYGSARATPGFELDGRKGKRVDEILEISSVDWVTRAGAGGRAIQVEETDKINLQEGGTPVTDTANTSIESTDVESEDTITTPAETPQADIAPETETEPESPPAELETEPIPVDAEVVMEALNKSSLPAAAKAKLGAAQFMTLYELEHAIELEIAYLSEAVGAGKVVGLGELRATTKKPKPADIDAAKDRVIEQFFGTQKRGKL